MAISETCAAQSGFVNTRAVVEPVKRFEVDGKIASGMAAIIEPSLGNTTNERHLATFEANADGASGACRLAFAAASAGFTVTAGFALAKALAAMLGAGAWFEIVEAHVRWRCRALERRSVKPFESVRPIRMAVRAWGLQAPQRAEAVPGVELF